MLFKGYAGLLRLQKMLFLCQVSQTTLIYNTTVFVLYISPDEPTAPVWHIAILNETGCLLQRTAFLHPGCREDSPE